MELDISSLAGIPTSFLQAELSKRQDAVPQKPACGSKNSGTYNTAIHVGALILILVLSVAACAFPIAAKRFPKLPIPHHFLFLSRHFGAGVLIATAFVHLFPTAYVSLTDPCLPSFWNKRYTPMAGLIAMTAVFLVVSIEMFFAMRGAGHIHSSDFDNYPDESGHAHSNGHATKSRPNEGQRSFSYKGLSAGRSGVPSELGVPSSENLLAGRSPSMDLRSLRPDDDLELEDVTDGADESLLNDSDPLASTTHKADSSGPDKKALLQCLLLEAGILFHSVFIGMAISVTPAPAFWVLLIAISFHQTFEGLALGSRISALDFHPGSPQPWLMALAYGTTTPLGQAIGLAIHRLYDPASETGLLSVGIMNALSSGLLLFAGLVELLAADFLSDESYATLKGKRRLQACGSVIAGAFLMALVGAWA